MERYNKIKQTFADYECELLTTYEEYIEYHSANTKHPRYKIIAICGHIVPNCWFHMFKYRGTGLLCNSCIDNNHKEHNKSLYNNLQDTNYYSLKLESNSIDLIQKYSENIIEINKTNECCLADIMIRVKGIHRDEWLPVQVKSTLKGRHNIYSFGVSNNYPNMLIILVCIEDEKFWLMNGNIVLNQCKISIGMQKSEKYAQYSVNKEDLGKMLKSYYDIYNKDSYNNINIPQTPEYIKECEYKVLRESYLPNIKFINSNINQQVYDFVLNGNKVQEKVAYQYKNKNSICVKLAKNKNGEKNQPYEVGDNDFYWINLPDKQTFYIISESILEKEGIISNKIQKGKSNIYFTCKNWTYSYKYMYTSPDIEDIIQKIFNMKTI